MSKGVNIKRTTRQPAKLKRSERDIKEEKRIKNVKKEATKIDRLSSDMNACQAVVKPDCSKPKVQKSQGIQKALQSYLAICINSLPTSAEAEKLLNNGYQDNLIIQKTRNIPVSIKLSAACTTIEFAGVKFITASVTDGQHYLKFIKDSILLKTLTQMPNVRKVAICEEKYS